MRHQKSSVSSENTVELQANGSLSSLLKQATAEIHHEIEHGSDINQKIVERTNAESYRTTYEQFLLTAYGFEKAVLEKIEDFGAKNLSEAHYPAEPDVSAALILDDFAAVNEDFDYSVLQTMSGLPEIHTLAELAGMEYVRRGSRNGNSYIARVVKNNLNIGAENGASFLSLDGNQVHPRWNAFKMWLDSLELSEIEMQQAVKSAVQTFKAVGDWHKSAS